MFDVKGVCFRVSIWSATRATRDSLESSAAHETCHRQHQMFRVVVIVRQHNAEHMFHIVLRRASAHQHKDAHMFFHVAHHWLSVDDHEKD